MTSVQEVTVEVDTDHELTAVMHQQVRQLTLVIEPTGDAADRIESIEGSLSGAAGTLDFATGTYGATSDVALHFTMITEGSDAGKWTATVRLLGITGNTQTLTVSHPHFRFPVCRGQIANLLQRDNEMLQIGLNAFMADREIFTMFAIGNNDDE